MSMGSENFMNHNVDLLMKEIENLVRKNNDCIANNKGKELSIFCTGLYGQKACNMIQRQNVNVDFFLDNNKDLAGKIINGKDVKTLSSCIEKKSFANIFVLIASSAEHYHEIASQLDFHQIAYMSYDAFIVSMLFGQYKEVLNFLDDERSRYSYLSAIHYYLTYRFQYAIVDDNQYFDVNEFKFPKNEIILDCGAYVGDSVEKYIDRSMGTFNKIYAFEPSDKLFKCMEIRVARLKNEWGLDDTRIELVNAGLGLKTEQFGFSENHGMVVTDENSRTKLQVYRVDDYFNDKKITLIKSDIEGLELDMIKGAKQTIIRYMPKLAISIYHSPEDMFSILNYIKEIAPVYKFAVRKHTMTHEDTLLYGWVQ